MFYPKCLTCGNTQICVSVFTARVTNTDLGNTSNTGQITILNKTFMKELRPRSKKTAVNTSADTDLLTLYNQLLDSHIHTKRRATFGNCTLRLSEIRNDTLARSDRERDTGAYLIKLYDVRVIEKLHDLNLTVYFLQIA